jgi:hypothetical protein
MVYIDPAALTDKVIELERKHGTNRNYIASLAPRIDLLLGNKTLLSTITKRVATHLLSPILPSPTIGMEAVHWAEKNTMFAASTLLYAAASAGLVAAPMEGFDQRRLCGLLQLSLDDFSIPLIVSLGYPVGSAPESADASITATPAAAAAVDEKQPKPKVRFPISDMCFYECYGQSISVMTDTNK